MNRPRWMELPRKVLVSRGALGEVPLICADLKLEGRALVVTGQNTLEAAGREVSDLLEEKGYKPEIVVGRASRIDEVDRAEAVAWEMGAGFIVGVGGGRSIDISKLVSLRTGIPFLSIPTAASHDGICSSQASLTVKGETVSIPARAPLAIVADTDVISKAPNRLLAAGCGDVISNYTALLDWEMARRLRNEDYSEYAAALSGMTAKMIMELAPTIRPGSEESVRAVVKALISSSVAMSIAGSSRPGSGSEHKFAHAINRVRPGAALHGELCGLGTITMMYLHQGDWKAIRDALQHVGAPTTAAQLSIPSEVVVKALILAHEVRPERYTILDAGLTEEALALAAEATGII
jgi:glycerol-1-phosphate dehydrogenase [NAD(P)+]